MHGPLNVKYVLGVTVIYRYTQEVLRNLKLFIFLPQFCYRSVRPTCFIAKFRPSVSLMEGLHLHRLTSTERKQCNTAVPKVCLENVTLISKLKKAAEDDVAVNGWRRECDVNSRKEIGRAFNGTNIKCRCRRPCVLRRRFAAVRFLGLWVRFPLRACLFVLYLLCVLRGAGHSFGRVLPSVCV